MNSPPYKRNINREKLFKHFSFYTPISIAIVKEPLFYKDPVFESSKKTTFLIECLQGFEAPVENQEKMSDGVNVPGNEFILSGLRQRSKINTPTSNTNLHRGIAFRMALGITQRIDVENIEL